MRSTLKTALAVVLTMSPVLSQTIDLSKWNVEQFNGTGTWAVDAPRKNVLFTVSSSSDCSILYSDFAVSTIDFRLTIKAVGDDDLVGFALGFNPGDFSNSNADYLLVDWKKVTQTYSNWGTSKAGLALSRVTGVPTKGSSGGGPIDLWSHTGVCKELARGTNFGTKGWGFLEDYYFRVIFTPGLVQIFVNGQQEFRVSGTFKTGGRFALYNFSQSGMLTQFPVPGSLKLFGTGCKGSNGTPYLFSPQVPEISKDFPIIVANVPSTAPALLVLGLSNTKWSAFTLPLDLTAFGATGCSLYTSFDLLLPMTNYNGTGYLNLPIPYAIPGGQFYVQGLTLDPSANSLGLVFSNAGDAKLGIR